MSEKRKTYPIRQLIEMLEEANKHSKKIGLELPIDLVATCDWLEEEVIRDVDPANCLWKRCSESCANCGETKTYIQSRSDFDMRPIYLCASCSSTGIDWSEEARRHRDGPTIYPPDRQSLAIARLLQKHESSQLPPTQKETNLDNQ